MRIPNDLEVIAARLLIAQLERIQSNPISEQMHAEMKLMALPGRVEHFERLELDMLKLDAAAACDLFVEAKVAELAVTAFKGPVADAATDWDRLPATVAGVRCRLGLAHFFPVPKTPSSLLRECDERFAILGGG